jgi:adenine phosphoribosyltransferase
MYNLENYNVTPPRGEELAGFIRTVEDFPKPGISFKDISPLLANPEAFREVVHILAEQVQIAQTDVVVGLDARGLIFGIAVAQELDLPFVMARKPGKLPGGTVSVDYGLEYGHNQLEMQRDSIVPGSRVAVIDDVLATGGTAAAAGILVQELGGSVSGYFFALELGALDGRKSLEGANVFSAIKF